MGIFNVRAGDKVFVVWGGLLFTFLQRKNQPLVVPLNQNDFSFGRFIKQLKPILSRFRRGDVLHVYNVHYS